MEIDAEILQNGTSTSPQQLANAINQDHDYLGEGEAKEVEAAEKVINAMRFYRKYCMIKLKRQADTIKSLPEEDKCLLITNSTEHLRKIKDLVEENQKVFEIIIHCGANILGGAVQKAFELTRLHSSSDHYMLKAKSTLKQIVRDWSAEGAFERDSCYRLVLQEMHRLFPSPSERHSVQVLVTGAGLARLAWELRIAGFSVTGNEFSYFMLLASNFILNACQQKEEFTIYPYVLDFSNSWNYENQLKPVKFPDVDPSSAFDSQRTNTFSMCAGDFLQAYADTHSQFDSVVSVFFIDTGPNPLQYIRLAHQILKSSGVWLNFGPLTYHHEDSDEPSLELPFSVILQLVEQCGFKVELVLGQGQHPPSLYTCNPNSMLQYNYHCGYFVARKI